MSIVGTRPPTLDEWNKYELHHRARHAYFHGHTVGGTNPSLIEALGSTDLNLLVDVGFNKEVAEDCALYWSRKPGSLAKLIDSVTKKVYECR